MSCKIQKTLIITNKSRDSCNSENLRYETIPQESLNFLSLINFKRTVFFVTKNIEELKNRIVSLKLMKSLTTVSLIDSTHSNSFSENFLQKSSRKRTYLEGFYPRLREINIILPSREKNPRHYSVRDLDGSTRNRKKKFFLPKTPC